MLYSVEQRECTDIFCLFVFIALVGIILSISVYAWTAGNFQKMKTAYDSDGKGCGTDYPDYPYIYFASPHTDVVVIKFSHYGSQHVFLNAHFLQTQY
jgi:hypothetical protein